jgi:hypothetical protein
MQQLVLHPDCAPGLIQSVAAEIVPTTDGYRATFVARGDVAKIVVPAAAAPGRHDNLWQTTCFEVFWSLGGTGYREFNLSPSSRWACYDFDAHRQGMRNASAEVEIDVVIGEGELRLTADIRSTFPLPAKVALNAIIAEEDGMNRYWALAFRAGVPDFHASECRALELPA